MRIHRLVAIVVAILFAAPASAQGPSPNNAVWGVSGQNQVFRWNSAIQQFEQMPGSLKQVSIGTDGAVWGVDPDDNIHRWTGSQWQQVPGELKQLSVRNAQEVWGVNAANDLFRWNGSMWEQISTPGKFKHVSVGVDGTVWAVDAGGTVLRRDGSTWTTIPGKKLEQISVTNTQRVWGIDADAQLFRWTGTDWENAVGEYLDVTQAADGELWRVYINGTIHFSLGPTAPTQRMHYSLSLKQIAVGSAGPAVPPSPTPPPTGPDSPTAEQQQTLEAHNSERRNYSGVGSLQWSPELARYAQEWAQRLANEGSMRHRQNYSDNPFRPGERLGENIYSAWSSEPATGREAGDAVRSWISEKQWYHYAQDDGMAGYGNQPPGCTPPPGQYYCGHFTQVIWRATQFLGCGKATAARNGLNYVYVVCNYYPGGNMRGEKPY